MDSEDLEPMDILSYITEELQERYRSAKDVKTRASVCDDFLQRWEADKALEPLRNLQVEFEADLDWFNVSKPLSMAALRGKLVVLDFFTYCCINCMHVLPELRKLEELFPVERGLVVVGVHSPKFANERGSQNILAAAQRYDVVHPIVNDSRSTLWRGIGIRCWPTLLVLSPQGVPLLMLMGEGHGPFLERFVEQALNFFEIKDEIETFSLPIQASADLLPASNLRFPAKIARSDAGRFAVADAGNNRILIFDRDGVVVQKVGGTAAGFIDGNLVQARFNAPQGVTFLNEDVLIVADTENHALRKVSLSTRSVETLAGTGQQGHDRAGGKEGPLQSISSPWDVAVFRTRDMDMSFHLDERTVPEKTIILASMSGTHQIWGYFPDGIILWKFRSFEPRTCVALIGNGMEENRNNSYPQNAGFAQPSGLAMAKDFLFIADSESSSIRKVSMLDGKVTGVVGGDRNPLNLFAFGDVDGKQYNAKLQHPLGVAYNHVTDKVYVADTYNHKIKVIDYANNAVETVPIKNASGAPHQFNEPAGLCFDSEANFLLVSDTNNHMLQLVDMKTLNVRPFNLNFSQLPQFTEIDSPDSMAAVRGGALALLKSLPLQSAKQFKLRIAVTLDGGLKFTSEAPQKWRLAACPAALQALSTSGELKDGSCVLQLQRRAPKADSVYTPQEEEIKCDLALSLCDAKFCLMKRFALVLRDSGTSSNGDVCNEVVKITITPTDIKFS